MSNTPIDLNRPPVGTFVLFKDGVVRQVTHYVDMPFRPGRTQGYSRDTPALRPAYVEIHFKRWSSQVADWSYDDHWRLSVWKGRAHGAKLLPADWTPRPRPLGVALPREAYLELQRIVEEIRNERLTAAAAPFLKALER